MKRAPSTGAYCDTEVRGMSMLYGDSAGAEFIYVEREMPECHQGRNVWHVVAKKKEGQGKRLLYRDRNLKSH